MNKITISILASLTFFFLVQIIWGSSLPLTEDEAYYWVWSKQLDLGYFDHPPMIAYQIAAGCAIFGDTELGVRIFPILLGVGSYGLLAWSAKDKPLAVWIVGSLPLFAVGGILATPDSPLIAAWCLAIWSALRKKWFILGVAAGLAMMSKYTGAMLLPAILLANPKDFASKGPWIAILVAVLVYSPNIWWNWQHEMVSWKFQLAHVAHSPKRLQFFAGQVALVGPIIFITGLCWLLHKPIDRQLRICYLATGVPLLAGILAGGEANWCAPAYIAMAVGLASLNGRWNRAAWTGVGLNIAISFFVLAHAKFNLIAIPKDPMHRLQGGQLLADSIKAWGTDNVWTERYQEASWIHFYGGVPAHVIPGVGRPTQYDLWDKEFPEKGIFVRPATSFPPSYLTEMGKRYVGPNQIQAYADAPKKEAAFLIRQWESYEFRPQ